MFGTGVTDSAEKTLSKTNSAFRKKNVFSRISQLSKVFTKDKNPVKTSTPEEMKAFITKLDAESKERKKNANKPSGNSLFAKPKAFLSQILS